MKRKLAAILKGECSKFAFGAAKSALMHYTIIARSHVNLERRGSKMTVWQAVELDTETVIYQADSAKELAAFLCVTPHAIYMAWYRSKACLLKAPGRTRHYLIEKVVIEDD